jgi:predicted DNA-binding transcriptional regulator YafY
VLAGCHDAARMLIGWCELRKDFRSFRIDRIVSADFLQERYPARAAAPRTKWLASLRKNPPRKMN